MHACHLNTVLLLSNNNVNGVHVTSCCSTNTYMYLHVANSMCLKCMATKPTADNSLSSIQYMYVAPPTWCSGESRAVAHRIDDAASAVSGRSLRGRRGFGCRGRERGDGLRYGRLASVVRSSGDTAVGTLLLHRHVHQVLLQESVCKGGHTEIAT